jgi:hypothetical protein
VIDMLFGTFKNPEYFEPEAGYYPGAWTRIPEMLVGFDVSTPRREPGRAPEVSGRSPLAS